MKVILVMLIALTPFVITKSIKHPFKYLGDFNSTDNNVKKYYYSDGIVSSFAKSENLCQIFGMNLLRFESEIEDKEFREKYSSLFENGASFAFVGANTTDLKAKLKWKWTNGEDVKFPVTWGDNQPNLDSKDEACLGFDEANPLKYHDLECKEKFSFFCQEEWTTKTVTFRVADKDEDNCS
jgi:Lectin C-type domain